MENMEKRKRLRVSYRTGIEIQHGDQRFEPAGGSVNLSRGGIFVTAAEKISLGTACRVRLCLAGTEDPVELIMLGRVVREEADGFGIQFDEMDLDTYTLLKEIIRYNASDADLA